MAGAFAKSRTRGVANLFPPRSNPRRPRARRMARSPDYLRCQQHFGLAVALSPFEPRARRRSHLEIIR
jgi:hypothetical protein